MIIGECLAEGIGDPSGRVVPVRLHKRLYMRRAIGYGQLGTEDYNDQIVASGRYPLFNGVDMRDGTINTDYERVNWKKRPRRENAAYGIAYHFHNWFPNSRVLRNKYKTYGHGDKHTYKKTLSDLNADLDVMVRCSKNLVLPNNSTEKKRYELPYEKIQGPKPIYFLNETYRRIRHETLQRQVIQEDEALYSSNY
mmetsp:Transcript_10157/g.11598  ORF Transcript_10157/g.11598 Transcript_10157/m.11598 type:complete len:195 (+) Transcript_10157:91-675(+)